jgi:hypothetical protein
MPADNSRTEIIRKIIFVDVDICRINRPEPAKIKMIGMLVTSLIFRLKFSETKK